MKTIGAHQFVFIDSRLGGAATLAHEDGWVVAIDPSADAFVQISNMLAAHPNVDSVQLIPYTTGKGDELYLGSQRLDGVLSASQNNWLVESTSAGIVLQTSEVGLVLQALGGAGGASSFAPAQATDMAPTAHATAILSVPSATATATSKSVSYSSATADYAPGCMIVKFKDGVQLDAVQCFDWAHDVVSSKTWSLTGAQLWTLGNGVSVEQAVSKYAATGLFDYVTPDYIIKPTSFTSGSGTSTTPNDPGFGSLWGLNNANDADIDAPEAWQVQAGGSSSFVVGVIDTGVDINHPDLQNNIWTNPGEVAGDGIDNDSNGYVDDVHGWDFAYDDNTPDDLNGHGTHVAGTIAAEGNNGLGVIGLAYNVKIMPIKIFNESGSGSISDAVDAINYAVKMGVKVTNNSWSFDAYFQPLYDAILAAGQAGDLFIASAGNKASNNDLIGSYPTNYKLDNIISVAASTSSDTLAPFSNYGATTVDLAAPGVGIYSTLPTAGSQKGTDYGVLSGTSMATPHVTGAVALLWSQHPDWSAQDIKEVLLGSVDHVAALSGTNATDGRLNINNALTIPTGTVNADVLNGADASDALFGLEGDDVINGKGGDDTLYGGAGADTLNGGNGDDTYIVDNAGDFISENASEGTDTVRSSATYTLGANLEKMLLTGSAAINATGNALNNVLTGNDANNTLKGGGGNDILQGGAGSDAAVFSGNQGDYRIDGQDGAWIVTDMKASDGDEGRDTLQSIERLQFADGNFAITQEQGGFLVNSYTADIQTESNVTALSDGGFVVTWSSEGQDGSGFGIYAQRYDAQRQEVGGEFRVNSYTTNNQIQSSTVALSDGGFLVTWQSLAQDGMGYGIYAQRYNGQSQAVGGEFQVNSYTYYGQSDPCVAALGDGGFIVTWMSSGGQDGSAEGIYAQCYNGQSQVVGGEFRVNSQTANSQTDPSVTALGDGSFVVTWTSTNQNATAANIYGQRYNSQSQAVGGEFQVNSDTVGGPSQSVVTALGDGGFVVTWMSYGDGSSAGIYARYYNAQFEAVGDQFQVNSYVTNAQLDPDVIALRNGGFVVTWTSYDQDGSGHGIYAQRYNAQLQRVGGEFRVNSYTTDNQTASSVTALSDGGFVVTWQSLGQDGSGSGIYAQVYDSQGNAVSAARLQGSAGADTMNVGLGYEAAGGAGDDVYIISDSTAQIFEKAGEGTDTVQSSVTYSLGSDLENLTLTDTAAINGTGNALNNLLTGNAAGNTLDGGAGVDTLIGGLGNDTYVVDSTTDTITENANEGTDTVQSSVTYTLGSNLENLTLTGAAAINGRGNAANNALTGNAANNTLSGGAGNDTLDGGAGVDTLKGGQGNDTYVVDSTTDALIENANEGKDTVQSSVTYTLGANLENLNLTGAAAINGTGNAANNALTGNAANNTLYGGLGADTLLGGYGNDVYVFNRGDGQDVVIDTAGDDTLRLGAGIELEDVKLTTSGADMVVSVLNNGTATTDQITLKNWSTLATRVEWFQTADGRSYAMADVLQGTAGNNTLTGTANANVLNGGAGADTLRGGAGDDTYIVDNAGDAVAENANKGIDTVRSSVTYTLTGNVENLTLTGTATINGTGNALNNTLTGNTANNVLTGGDGADTFVFNTALSTTNIDTLADFSSTQGDKIALDDAVFAMLLGKTNLTSNFRLNTQAAVGGDDYIVYNASTGQLSYDATGSGSSTAVVFATLTNMPQDLTTAQFVVI